MLSTILYWKGCCKRSREHVVVQSIVGIHTYTQTYTYSSFHLYLVMRAKGRGKREEKYRGALWLRYVHGFFLRCVPIVCLAHVLCETLDAWMPMIFITHRTLILFIFFLFSSIHHSFENTFFPQLSRSSEGCLFCHSTYDDGIIPFEWDTARNQNNVYQHPWHKFDWFQSNLIDVAGNACPFEKCHTAYAVCLTSIDCIWKQVFLFVQVFSFRYFAPRSKCLIQSFIRNALILQHESIGINGD